MIRNKNETMKEKMEKLKAYLQSWKFCIHLNAMFMLIHIVSMIIDFQIANLTGATFHFGFIVMTWMLSHYDKRHRKDTELISALDHLIAYMVKESEKQNSLKNT